MMALSQTYKDWHPFASHYPDSLLTSSEASRIAQTIMSYQTPVGGWPKNIFFPSPSAADGRALRQRQRKGLSALSHEATIDNGATTVEIRFLMRVCRANYHPGQNTSLAARCRQAVIRGIEYLLCMQYTNGGFPQYWPRSDHYHAAITFNDDAMVNAMRLLRDFATLQGDFSVLAADTADHILPIMQTRAAHAYIKGISCILRCQLKDNRGHAAVWCQQHDPVTLEPVGARTFELPSFCTAESVTILRLLQESINDIPALNRAFPSVHSPTPIAQIQKAITDAERWMERHAIKGVRKEFFYDSSHKRDYCIVLCLPDEQCPPLWARFYDLKEERPLFCGRDGKPHRRVEEIDSERRNGYAWYNSAFTAYQRDFPRK